MGCIYRFADNIFEMIFYFRYDYFLFNVTEISSKGSK